VLFGDTAREPWVAFLPIQPPPAVQEVALVEDQVTIEIWPDVMLVGLTENATVGGGVGDGRPLGSDGRPLGSAELSAHRVK
jgi:hypothetical protein